MKNLLIGLIIGSAIGGIWVQFRITGGIWNRDTTKNAYENGYFEGREFGFNEGLEIGKGRGYVDGVEVMKNYCNLIKI